jgi:spermidine/putrescine transport system substrate-binding protein
VGQVEDALAVYNWSDYIAPATVPAFARALGVAVTYDTFESNEEMFAKLVSGAAGYDLVVPSSYLLPAMHAMRLLQPIRHEWLANLGHIAPLFRDPPFDPGNAYTVPWQWGVTGIAWRRDKVDAPAGWSVFHDARWAGRMTMMDDVREVLGAMLKARGRSLNTTDPAALAAAKEDALRAKRLLRAYKSAQVKSDLVAGDVWIAQMWNGDAAQAAAEEPAIAFMVPPEGSMIWTDSMVLLANAPHPRAAHAFLDWCLRPEVAAANADASGYGSPNAAALALQQRPVAYPTPEERARLEYPDDLGLATELWDRLWTEVKAG